MDHSIVIILPQIVYVLVQLITSLYLFIRVYQNKIFPIVWLAFFFILFPLQLLFQFFLPFFLYAILSNNGPLFLLIFVKKTFFTKKKSSFRYLFALAIGLRFLELILKLSFQFTIPLSQAIPEDQILYAFLHVLSIALSQIISAGWLSWVVFKDYYSLKDKDIEPWIKFRYFLVGFSSFFFGINGITVIFYAIYGDLSAPMEISGFLLLVSSLTFALGNLIAWVMPQNLKNYINRNYAIDREDLSEEQLNEILQKEFE